MRALVAVAAVVGMAGCAQVSSNMRLGNDQSYIGLKEQREAVTHVQQVPEAPPGSSVVAVVDAARCHRYAGTSPPTDEQVTDDLKIAAYAKGADAITDIRISQEAGLVYNCWHVLTGRATALRLTR